MKSQLSRAFTLILVGTFIRVGFIIYMSQFEDIMKQQLAGTDIDYKVYTDAAYYQSPYHRHTYRYTPLLAYLMKFNHLIQYAGKLFFVLFDVLAMIALILMNRKNYRNTILAVYALNPIFIYLTARGSCESISLALMFWCFYLIFQANGNVNFSDILNRNSKVYDNRRLAWLGYIIYGLWVHFRVYPLILLPLILIHEYKLCQKTGKKFINKFIQMSVFAGGTFLGLFALFYIKYGMIFVEETYLYHLKRLDNRHSFSPIFYQIYLSLNTQSAMRSMAQLVVIMAVTKKAHQSISPYYAHFVITYGFVSFNKVITMQYYMWILGSLLLILPQSTLLSNPHRRFQKCLGYSMQYSLGILLWVWASIKLQKQGESIFNLMWLIGIGKLFSDLWAIKGFLSTIKNKQGYKSLPSDQQIMEEPKPKGAKSQKSKQ